jgi:hypothetical protein
LLKYRLAGWQAGFAMLLRLVFDTATLREQCPNAQIKTGRWNSLYSPRFCGILQILNFS